MDMADPASWRCPTGWHADWDGEWEFDRLRELGVAFLGHSEENRVRLDIVEVGYVRVMFFRGAQRLGTAYVNRESRDSPRAIYQLNIGTDDTEHTVKSVGEGVRLLMEARNAWEPDDD